MPSQLFANAQQSAADLSYLQSHLQTAPYIPYQAAGRINQPLHQRGSNAATTQLPRPEAFPQSFCMSSIVLPSSGLQGTVNVIQI